MCIRDSLRGNTLADEIEALATLTVADANAALQSMLSEDRMTYVEIEPQNQSHKRIYPWIPCFM